jgi:hypothetical protein
MAYFIVLCVCENIIFIVVMSTHGGMEIPLFKISSDGM